jgi:hypothetical protein
MLNISWLAATVSAFTSGAARRAQDEVAPRPAPPRRSWKSTQPEEPTDLDEAVRSAGRFERTAANTGCPQPTGSFVRKLGRP